MISRFQREDMGLIPILCSISYLENGTKFKMKVSELTIKKIARDEVKYLRENNYGYAVITLNKQHSSCNKHYFCLEDKIIEEALEKYRKMNTNN